MFAHIYTYMLKCIVKDKQMMFWTLIFPILLATLFQMAFSNISSSEVFKEIPIAVVDNAEYREDAAFQNVLKSVSASSGEALFKVEYTSKEAAEALLKEEKIQGIINFDGGLKLIVKDSGLNQTIIKSFLDDYSQTSSTVYNIISKNPEALQNGLLNGISDRSDYLKESMDSRGKPETTVHYFYTLIGMFCLYGGFFGLKVVSTVQANQSAQGARINIAPTHKLKVFSVSILSAVTIQLLEILILLAYLIFILKVDFGNQLGYLALTSVVGTFTGVTFGAFISTVITKGEGVKIAILISISMTMSFLSGMMYANLKTIISRNVPILGYLNPANLISDSFYSLYFYNDHKQYFINTLLLCGFTVVFSLLTYLVMRRQKYASI